MNKTQTSTKIIFICHGNICRSTMAEGLAKELFVREKIADKAASQYGEILFTSRAVSNEALGSPPYPLTMQELLHQGFQPNIYLADKTATKLTDVDFADNCYLFYMDQRNYDYLRRYYGADKAKRCRPLLSKDIADPWYTRDFTTCFYDIKQGIEQLFGQIIRGEL